jgi:hypothetical protein
MTAVRSRYTAGPVQITKHHIDWDTVHTATADRISALPPDASRVYLNPGYTVECPADAPLDQFIRQARRAQVIWNMLLARQFGSGTRKRLIKKADSRTRQLVFTGVLYLDGRPVDPKGWPDAPAKRSAKKKRAETWCPPPLGTPIDSTHGEGCSPAPSAASTHNPNEVITDE